MRLHPYELGSPAEPTKCSAQTFILITGVLVNRAQIPIYLSFDTDELSMHFVTSLLNLALRLSQDTHRMIYILSISKIELS